MKKSGNSLKNGIETIDITYSRQLKGQFTTVYTVFLYAILGAPPFYKAEKGLREGAT
jgi:hypothetical protein